MSETASLHIAARDIPAPNSVSKQAQAALIAAAARPAEDLPALGDTASWLVFIEAQNASLAAMIANSPILTQVAVETMDFGGAPGFRSWPKQGDASQRIVYNLHGGGLYLGGGETCRLMAMPAAAALQATVYAMDYRMPPLHPYPAALDDCVTGYRFLLGRYRPDQIIVQGASAGGNLAAALMLRCHAEQLPLPAGVILMTPELDLTESGDSFAVIGAADVVLKRSLMPANLLYAAGHDLSDPMLSPLFGDFSKGFAPTAITAGTRDLFLSNAVRMHNALRRSGNTASFSSRRRCRMAVSWARLRTSCSPPMCVTSPTGSGATGFRRLRPRRLRRGSCLTPSRQS